MPQLQLSVGELDVVFENVVGQPVAVEQGVLQRGRQFFWRDRLADVVAVAEEQERDRTHVPAAREHQAEPGGVVGVDAVERPTRFVAAIVEVGRAVAVKGCARVERVGDVEVDPGDVHVVGPPLHLRVRQVLTAGAEDLDDRQVVVLAVSVGDRAAELGRLVGAVVLAAGHELTKHRVDGAHVGVLLHLEHVAGATPRVQVLVSMLQPVPDGLHAMLAAPPRQPAV